MGQLIVRGLDDRLIQALKQPAARAGRAAEAEHRAILEQALQRETETFAEGRRAATARTPPQTTDSAGLERVRQAVVDASVAVKWVVKGDHGATAALLFGFDACNAPDHWRTKAVNVLWSKVLRGDLTAADAEERMTVLLRAPVIGAPIADLMARAFAISVAHTVTIYESLYVALAERRDITMVAADERLIRRCGFGKAHGVGGRPGCMTGWRRRPDTSARPGMGFCLNHGHGKHKRQSAAGGKRKL